MLRQPVDAAVLQLLVRALGAGGPTRTLTATSLFWLLLYVGWQAGMGVEAAVWLSAGAALGALATRGASPSGAEERPPRRYPPQSTSR